MNGAPRPGAVLGVAVDTTRQRLWLTTANLPHMADAGPADTVPAELLCVRLEDGVLERRWRLGTGRGVPGELAIMPDGEVLVSDGTLGVLYRLAPDADTVVTITSPLLRSPRVVRLVLAPTGVAVTAVEVLDVPDLPGEPTVSAVLNGVFVYVATSHWPFVAEDGTRRGVEARPGVVVRGVAVGQPVARGGGAS